MNFFTNVYAKDFSSVAKDCQELIIRAYRNKLKDPHGKSGTSSSAGITKPSASPRQKGIYLKNVPNSRFNTNRLIYLI